jgi:hypothetical protein
MLLWRKCHWIYTCFHLIGDIRYISDAKIKREPAQYGVAAAEADPSEVLGKREPGENDALVA